MKKGVLITTLILVSALAAGSATAETEISISGQVRIRQEVSSKDFADTAKVLESSYLRTRLAVEAVVDNSTHAYVQFQDSRILGGDDQFGELQSGTLNDGKNVDVHQAYIQVDRFFFDNISAKMGRFELNLGSQRVFGAVGWHNVGRSWEGGQLMFENPKLKAIGLSLKAREDNYWAGNTDFGIVGLYATAKKVNLDLFAIYEHDATKLGVGGELVNQLKRFNLGTYYHRTHQQLDFNVNFVYQLGKQPGNVTTPEIDISAFMATFEAGYNFPCERNLRLAAGIDYASGDNDPTDDKHKAYNNLYYTGHKFRGYMDYFIGSSDAGLMDLMLRAKFNPHPKWTVKGDIHYFQTAQDYAGWSETGNVSTSDLGMEFDLTVSTSVVEGLGAAFGASAFMPKEAYAGIADPETAYWLYGQMTANF